jgi:hypothetical protein
MLQKNRYCFGYMKRQIPEEISGNNHKKITVLINSILSGGSIAISASMNKGSRDSTVIKNSIIYIL